MASSGSGLSVSAGSGVATNNNQTVYYNGSDQNIHQMLWRGSKWLDINLMTSSQSGMTSLPGISPAADTSGNVWYVGTDQCVHQMYWGGSQWMDVNWTQGAGSGTLVALGTTLATNNSGVVYFVGTDQCVHQMFASGGGDADINITANSGSGMTVLAGTSPTADTSGHVWYAGADQGVHELYWGGSTWVDSNWTASSGSGLLTAQGTSFSTDNQGTVYYIAGNQDVQQMFWGGSRYLDADLMASSGSGSTAYVPRNATVQNLTNPTWGASFNVGDTMSVTVTGPANMPVSLSQSPGGTTQMGYTNANGVFTYSAVENTSNIGSYTQVWSVGTTAASPSISYLVGQLGNPGTISTTSTAQAEGDYVTGISTLSITNNYINTYSATELNYDANLYYDSGTVATLFDNGTQINQLSGTYFAMMSGNANAWDDYDLQTDHYVDAFDDSGVYYNPLYFGEDGCDGEIEDGTDCTLGSGEGSYVLAEAELYLGSTIADQTNVPQNGSSPPCPSRLYDNFLESFAASPYPNGPDFYCNTNNWWPALAAFGAAVAVGEASSSNPQSSNQIPFLVELQPGNHNDYYDNSNESESSWNETTRFRYYMLKDTYGRPWVASNNVIVGERFSDRVGAALPAANGLWYGGMPVNGGQAILSDPPGNMNDHYGLNPLSQSVGYIQYYYAYRFTPPSWLNFPGGLLAPVLPPSLPGYTGGPVVRSGLRTFTTPA